jgi:hypothetical protein
LATLDPYWRTQQSERQAQLNQADLDAWNEMQVEEGLRELDEWRRQRQGTIEAAPPPSFTEKVRRGFTSLLDTAGMSPYMARRTSEGIFGRPFARPQSELGFIEEMGAFPAVASVLRPALMAGVSGIEALLASARGERGKALGYAGLGLLEASGAKGMNKYINADKPDILGYLKSRNETLDVNPAALLPRRSSDDISYEDAYHFMKSNKMIGDKLMPPSEGARFDRLGVHVGTPRQAEDRFFAKHGVSGHKNLKEVWDAVGLYGDSGVTQGLKVRTEKPFEIKDFEDFGINKEFLEDPLNTEIIDGKTVLSEEGVIDAMNAYADNKGVGLDEGLALFKKELTDKGYTNIPYVNRIEGIKRSDVGSKDFKYTPENISNVMLVERTAADPEVIRSRFAAMKDPYAQSIMASGLLGAVIGQNANSQRGSQY